MYNLGRRLDKIEDKLNLSKKPTVVNIVHFGEELPPDRTDGNITVHFVKYDERAKQ